MNLTYREVVFKIGSEEDMGRLVALNDIIIKRINVLQSVARDIPKAPIAQPTFEPQIENSSLNEKEKV